MRHLKYQQSILSGAKRKVAAGAILLSVVVCILLVVLDLWNTKAKPFTIGVVTYVSIFAPAISGFKTGMTELGYAEGRDIIFIDNGIIPTPTAEAVDLEISNLLDRKLDLLLTVGDLATLRARQVTATTGLPVLFTLVQKPAERGVVASLIRPGGNITGVQSAGSSIKGLEWLVAIIPNAKKIYIPYNPKDNASVINLAELSRMGRQLGIELVMQEIESVQEAVTAIRHLPKDVDGIYRIPSPTLDPANDQLSRAAINRRLPMGAGLPLDESVLITFAMDFFTAGKQTARLAHQIRQGIEPAVLPVETADTILTINLKTAKEIGLNIGDDILIQAHKIIH